MTKHCSQCNNDLPLSKFGSNAVAKDGKNWYCKECARLRSKANATRAAIRRWIQKEPETCAHCGEKPLRIFVHALNSTILLCVPCVDSTQEIIARMTPVKLYQWLRERKCLQCDHVWMAMSRRPKQCPKCKSLEWDADNN